MAISEQEYGNIIRYLLDTLEQRQASNIAEEINELIRRGTTSTIADSRDLVRKNIKQSEVGKTQTRPLSSKEAFEKILEYLKKLILDIPAYEQQIKKTFGSNVVWEYDQGESNELRRLSEGFSVNALSYDKDDFDKANLEFDNLINYISDNGDLRRS